MWTYDIGGADEGDVPNNDYDRDNLVTVEQDAFSYATYMYTFTGSIYASFHNLLPPLGSSIPIPSGKQIATIGTRNSCHLHFGVGNSTGDKDLDPIFGSPDVPYVNYPVAFWNYEVCDKQKGKGCTDPANWYFVAYGVPVEDQFVRNP